MNTTTTIYSTKYYCYSMTNRSYNKDKPMVNSEVKNPRGAMDWGMTTYTVTLYRVHHCQKYVDAVQVDSIKKYTTVILQ